MASKNLHLMMTANASQQLAELKRLSGALNEIKTSSAGMQAGFGALTGAADPAAMLKGMATNALALVPTIGPALQGGAIAIEGFANKLSAVQEDISATGRSAMIAGSGFERFQAMMRAGRIDAESLRHGLGKFRVSVEDAARGNKELADTFKGLGLDPVQLSAKKTDDAFADLTAAFQKQENAGHRISDMHKILGRSFQELLPLLAKSKEQLEAIQARGVKSGAIVSEKDLIMIESARIQLKALEQVGTGVQNKLAIGWTKVQSAFSFMSTYLLTDKTFRQIANESIDAEKAIVVQKKMLTDQAAVDLRAAENAKRAKQLDDNAKFWMQMRENQAKGWNDLRDNAMTDGEKYFAVVRDLQAKIDALPKEAPGDAQQNLQRMIDKAKEQAAASVNAIGPADALAQRLAKLDDMQQHGALSAEQYAIALSELAKTAVSASQAIAPATIQRGTQAAFQAEFKAQNQDSRDIQAKMLDGINQMKEAQKQAVRDGGVIKDHIGDIRKALGGAGIVK